MVNREAWSTSFWRRGSLRSRRLIAWRAELRPDDFDPVVDVHYACGFHHCLLSKLQQVKLRQASGQSYLTVFDDNIQPKKLVITGLLKAAANRSFQFTVRRRGFASEVWSRCGF
ncbi:MAG: hypothetical protein ACI92S_005285 [Planctomycetaceae bacterium]|jgi:hypothetical protein